MLKYLATLTLVLGLLPFNSARAEHDWLYSVRPGDNVWDLCVKYTTKADCWLELGGYNSLDSDSYLPPGLIIRFPISWLKSVPTPVTISYFTGDVRYRLSADQETTAAQVGDKLPIGSVVVTGNKSIAGLLFGDGSIMQVESDSSVVLDSLSTPGGSGFVDSRIRLQSGAVKTRVPERQPKSRFQITTPAAIAAVRGTEFRVSAFADDSGGEAMTGEVFDGSVGVAGSGAGPTKSVEAGFGITAKKGQALADPKPLPATPEWAEIAQLQRPPIQASWQPVDEAAAYRLEILSIDDKQNTELLAVQTMAGNEFLDSQQSFIEGCFVLAVRAVDSEGLIGLANESQVCTRDKLAAPMVKQTSIKFNSESTEVPLDWQPVDGADSYRVEFSSTPDFKSLIEPIDVSDSVYVLPVTEATQGGFYYRVQAQGDDVVSSEFSAPRQAQLQDEPLKALAGWATFWVLLLAL